MSPRSNPPTRRSFRHKSCILCSASEEGSIAGRLFLASSAPPATTLEGCGRAILSTFPLDPRGISASGIMLLGIIAGGRATPRCTCNTDGSQPPVQNKLSRLRLKVATALSTPTQRAATTSISPSSILTPLRLIWLSTRPTSINSPCGVHLPMSPVLYIRPAPNGLAMNLLAVSSGKFRYPRETHGPPM